MVVLFAACLTERERCEKVLAEFLIFEPQVNKCESFLWCFFC